MSIENVSSSLLSQLEGKLAGLTELKVSYKADLEAHTKRLQAEYDEIRLNTNLKLETIEREILKTEGVIEYLKGQTTPIEV